MSTENVSKILDKIDSSLFNKEKDFVNDHPLNKRIFSQDKKLGEILKERGIITQEQLDFILKEQKDTGKRFGDLIRENRMVDDTTLSSSLAEQMNLPFYKVLPYQELSPTLVSKLTISFCTQNNIVPVSEDEFGVTVAVSDPLDTTGVSDLHLLLVKNIRRIVSPKDTIELAINSLFERLDLSEQVKVLEEDDDHGNIEGLDDVQDLLYDNEEAPVRKEVSTIIRRGIIDKASDIHIEPYEDRVSVRFRTDGVLRETRVVPKRYQSSITTRIKILAKLNIAESRIPQDGRISLKVGNRDIDVRVSTLPIKYGERIVLRILDKSSGLPELEKLGIPKKIFNDFESLIKQKHGIILVTGPTGSGKTTTLAASIMHINKPDISIITVEDPVEIQMPGVSQVEVNEQAGLTFAKALRSILRQNPNVILIGEIRDSETAQIAVQASMTGHLVLSTLHTNDTASSVTRLVDFGVEPFQITTTVNGILAVRLMRKLCKNCRKPYKYTKEELELFGIHEEDTKDLTLYRPKPSGCSNCKNTGFQGRIAIYELLVFNDDVRNFVLKSQDGASLKKMCVSKGMKTLRQNAIDRFLKGDTSLEEAITATQSEDAVQDK